jgi:hypothetical protein
MPSGFGFERLTLFCFQLWCLLSPHQNYTHHIGRCLELCPLFLEVFWNWSKQHSLPRSLALKTGAPIRPPADLEYLMSGRTNPVKTGMVGNLEHLRGHGLAHRALVLISVLCSVSPAHRPSSKCHPQLVRCHLCCYGILATVVNRPPVILCRSIRLCFRLGRSA